MKTNTSIAIEFSNEQSQVLLYIEIYDSPLSPLQKLFPASHKPQQRTVVYYDLDTAKEILTQLHGAISHAEDFVEEKFNG